MANQVLQPCAALAINHLSDDYDIPFHMVAVEGETTDGDAFKPTLIDANVNFITAGVKQGMIVWNTSSGASAIVDEVNDGFLRLDIQIFSSIGDKYVVFSAPNPGCLIRIGGGKNASMKVTTQAGDVVVFRNLDAGTILPVRISRVWSTHTDASNLIALW